MFSFLWVPVSGCACKRASVLPFALFYFTQQALSLLYGVSNKELRRLASYYVKSNFYVPGYVPYSLSVVCLSVCLSTACLGIFIKNRAVQLYGMYTGAKITGKVRIYRGRGGGMAMPAESPPRPTKNIVLQYSYMSVCMYVCMSKFITSLVVRVPFANCETRCVCW